MSYSVPTSPAVTRSTKTQPLTPQRPLQKYQQRSLYRSPLTPSTSPYTPISLRSADTTGSSTLATPDNSGLGSRKRLVLATSPDVVRNGSATKDRSLADLAENWRARTSSNLMKASYTSKDNGGYVIHESSDLSLLDVGNDSGITNEALLGAPFLATHRNLKSVPNVSQRPRAQSHASLPTPRTLSSSPVTSRKANAGLTTSPVHHSSSRSYTLSLMATPPPNRALTRQLKVKGSLTDPPQPRRREALGNVPVPSNNARNTNMTLGHDTSLDLFDIDETEVECENDEVENSFSSHLPVGGMASYGYPNFVSSFPPQEQPQTFGQSTFADPFQPGGSIHGFNTGQMLNSIGESVEHYFHTTRQQQQQQHPQHLYFEGMQPPVPAFFNPRLPPRFSQALPQRYHSPALVPIPQPPTTTMPFRPLQTRPLSSTSVHSDATSVHVAIPTDCSVCFAVHPSSLAILQPCGHPLCSGCLTSALNIVGEKDMACAVCKQAVADFRLVVGGQKSDMTKDKLADLSQEVGEPLSLASSLLKDPLSHRLGPFEESHRTHESSDGAFDFGLDFGELRASTPKMEQQISRAHLRKANHGTNIGAPLDANVVLRIDNVPWDITPLQISRWLQQPVERVHVLLDPKGKTLSHAYVEVRDAAIAGAILRGEASSPSGGKERGSVLGRGRRARGVTITRSGQPELMRDLFPHWRGNFVGFRPSLAGLDSEKMVVALEGGLMTEHEVSGLSQLIREPDSHFLKVPCLPFHSLISILIKFPDDADGRMFWSVRVRDMLFDAVYIACQVLRDRISKLGETTNKPEEYPQELLIDLFHTGLHCKAFTPNQVRQLAELAEAIGLPIPHNQAYHPSETWEAEGSRSSCSPDVNSATQLDRQLSHSHKHALGHAEESLDELAKEFGVETHVVQALAQRLAKLG